MADGRRTSLGQAAFLAFLVLSAALLLFPCARAETGLDAMNNSTAPDALNLTAVANGTNASAGNASANLSNGTDAGAGLSNGTNASLANASASLSDGTNASAGDTAPAPPAPAPTSPPPAPLAKKGLDYLQLQNLRSSSAQGGPKSFIFSRPASSGEMQYALVAGAPFYNFAQNDFAVSAWFNTGAQDGGILVSKADYLEGRGWRLMMDSDGILIFSINDAASSVEAETVRAFNDGSWHRVAAVRSGSAIRLYVDGEEMASAYGRQVVDASSNGPLSIGADMSDYDWSQTPRSQFVGQLGEPEFAGYAPSIGELRTAFAKGRR